MENNIMHLHEYQTKKLFACYGIPTPIGYVCNTLAEVEDFVSKFGIGPWVVKCQIHAGGRGKSGGIKVVKSKKEILTFAKYWLGNRLVTYQTNALGKLVNQILVEAAINIVQEFYLGAIIDRGLCRVVLMASSKGGVEIEKIADSMPNFIHKVALDPLTGPQPYQGRALAFKLGLGGSQISQFSKIFMGLATMFVELDLELVEINPLAITSAGNLICLDGKLSIDNSSLFRQPKLWAMYDYSQEDKLEALAAKWNLNYVTLHGNIGCMVNGAGLAMGIMDIIKLRGGEPANFLDVGGSATKEHITEAFKIILLDKKVKVVLVNIFGGIVRCDFVAEGIIRAIMEISISIPVVIRLEGNNAQLGIKMLVSSGLNITIATSLNDAVEHAISILEVK